MADDCGPQRKSATAPTQQEGRRRPTLSRLRAVMRGEQDLAALAELSHPRESLSPGTKVGRYEIIRLVGEGGMGTVYEALDARLGRKVALKVLSPSLKSLRKAAKRFSIEAQAAARLNHPNVVSIYDFDVDCALPYMAMQFLEGETLAAEIARGALEVQRVADILLSVCAGVHAAHEAGIVHRDLKPSNIFLCSDWQGGATARVLDFGISKVGGISGSGLTQTGDIVGTSQYLSPEQAEGNRHLTPLSDQYSLGVVMYECVTGRTPQQGLPIHQLLRNVSQGRCRAPRELRPDLPSEFEAIIERAMQVNPGRRFASVFELGCAIFPFASGEAQRRMDQFYRPLPPQAGRDDGFGKKHDLPSARENDETGDMLPRRHPSGAGQRTTRTSPRGGLGRGHDSQELSNTAPPSRSSRAIVLSIAVGVFLAVVVLGVVVLILHK